MLFTERSADMLMRYAGNCEQEPNKGFTLILTHALKAFL